MKKITYITSSNNLILKGNNNSCLEASSEALATTNGIGMYVR